MTRHRLPNRRDNESREIEINGRTYSVTVGFDEARRPRELFMLSGKPGSTVDILLGDAAVVISIALQHGIHPADMRDSMSRAPDAPLRPVDLDRGGDRLAASIIGAAIDLLAELDDLGAYDVAKP